MSNDKQTKINLLLQKWPKGTVATNAWLAENGVNASLKKRYVQTNWLQPIGTGAAIRAGDQIDWKGGVVCYPDSIALSGTCGWQDSPRASRVRTLYPF